MSQYDAIASRALDTITEKGGTITFSRGQTGAVYDPLTDSWSGGSDTPATGKAVQLANNPQKFIALSLTIENAITLLVAASGLSITPVPGDVFGWSGVFYAAKSVESTAPDGVPILYTIVGAK